MSLPSLPDGSNWSSRWQLNKESSTTLYRSLGESVAFFHSHLVILPELTAVHLITGILTVHLLVTLAGVGDAASVSALELIG